MNDKIRTLNIYTLLLFLLVITSCADKEKQDNPQRRGTYLVLNPSVELETSARNTNSLVASAQSQNILSSNSAVDNMQYFDEYDVLATVSNKEAAIRNISRANLQQGAAKLLAATADDVATQRLALDVTFRFIMLSGDLIISNSVYKVGEEINIELDGQATYRWFALSFENNDSALPMPNLAGTLARSELANKNFLFASGTLDAVSGENHLEIIFKRLTARIRVQLNARGLFGRINNETSISIVKNANNENAIKSGDFNIYTGIYANIQNVGPMLASAMVDEPGTPDITVKNGDFYTVDTSAVAAGNLKLRLNEVHVTLDDDRTRSFTTARDVVFNTAFTPKFGNLYELQARLVESAVKVKNILWARSNIIYTIENVDAYRLKSNPGGSTTSSGDTEFWNWQTSSPNSRDYGTLDPCTQVYPTGTWRMPTQQDWEAIGQPDENREILGYIYGAEYAYLWNRDADFPENLAYDDNNLFLSFGGYRDSTGIVYESPSGIGLGILASGQCHYWTSSQVNGAPVGVQASFSRLIWGISWGSITYPTSTTNNGKNIRCVRTSSSV